MTTGHGAASELIWFVFSAGGVVSAMLAGAVWLYWRPHSIGPRRFLAIAATTYTLASIFAISHAAGRLLVIGYRPLRPADVPPGRSAVVLLASGNVTTRDWTGSRLSVVDPVTASRVLEAARVFRLVNPEWVISSGGVPLASDVEVPAAITMRDTLVQLGVPEARILVEDESWNTYAEALILAPRLASLKIERTIVVTSDLHMRRSIGAFRAQGIDAIPAIARHPYADAGNARRLLPSAAGLFETALVTHEVFGIVYYAWRGWYRFSQAPSGSAQVSTAVRPVSGRRPARTGR